MKNRRDAVVIATKAASPLGPGPSIQDQRKHVMKACEDSLRRLDTDYIDLYQMHRYDDATPVRRHSARSTISFATARCVTSACRTGPRRKSSKPA